MFHKKIMRKCVESEIGKSLNQILVECSTVQYSAVQCSAVQSTDDFIQSSEFPLVYFTLVFQVTIFLVIGHHNPLY